MKVESYEILHDTNCYNIIGNLDRFQLDNTEDKMIMIDVKRNISKIAKSDYKIPIMKIELEEKKLNTLLSIYKVSYDDFISEAMEELGLDINGDLVNLRVFISALSCERKQMLQLLYKEKLKRKEV